MTEAIFKNERGREKNDYREKTYTTKETSVEKKGTKSSKLFC